MNKLIKEIKPIPLKYQFNLQAGFTLVELAVVIVIIGILASMGITALNVQMTNAAISVTKKNQDTIKDALIGYLGKNKRLPCPATDNLGGLDATSRNAVVPSNCKTYFGLVPYIELGLPKSVAVDGWDNFFTYAVSSQWTATLNTSVTPTAGGNITNKALNGFNVGNSGSITVKTRVPASQNPPTSVTTNSSKAVVALISYGLNGSGAFASKGTQRVAPSGADEVANAIAPTTLPLVSRTLTTLYQREFTDKDAGYGAFDDVVLWLSPNDIIISLIKDGSMKSAEAKWADQLTNIQNSISAQILSNQSSCSVNLILPNQNDPWGGNVRFTPTADPVFSSASSVPLYTLTLVSPNPNAGNFNGATGSFLAATYPTLSNCP